MKTIREQINEFLAMAQVPASKLAKESGVQDVFISRLRSGAQKDTLSRRVDAIRDAMQRIDAEAAKVVLE